MTCKRLLLALCGLLWLSVPASAQTYGCPAATVTLSSPGAFPVTSASDSVRITAAITLTTAVTRDASCVTIAAGGSLTLSGSGHLSAGTVIIESGGTITGSGSWSVSFKNQVASVDSYNVGLICLGTCNLQGTSMAKTFVRLAATVAVGATTLTTAEALGCNPGDVLWLPWTQQLINAERYTNFIDRSEYVTASSCSGTTVNLSAPTQFTHYPSKWRDNTVAYYPHVANTTRTARIYSESTSNRGHMIFLGSPTVTVKYVQIQYVGRTTVNPLTATNVARRYALHLHMIGNTAPQIVGNAILDTLKWGISIHMTHNGLIQDNVILHAGGAGIVTEDGSESFNTINRNYIGWAWGMSGRQHFGREGMGIWMRGVNNTVTNNVVANVRSIDSPEASYCYEYYQEQLTNITYPGGANVNPHKLPILQFANNECYASTSGLSFWWIGIKDTVPQGAPLSTVSNTVIWHTAEYGAFLYPEANVLYDGLVVLGERAVLATSYPPQIGVHIGDYTQHDVEFRNWRVENQRIGIQFPTKMVGGTFTVTSPILRNHTQNIQVGSPWSVSADSTTVGRRNLVLTNPTFLPTYNSAGNTTIDVNRTCGSSQGNNMTVLDRMTWDGDRIFTTCQRPLYVMATSTFNTAGQKTLSGQAPPGGLTNQQLFDTGATPYGGELATCLTSFAGLTGYRCDTGITPPPPTLPPASPNIPQDGQTGITDTLTTGSVVRWFAVTGATSYDVFHGTTTPPPFLLNTTGVFATVPQRADGQTYYWSVNPKNSTQQTVGNVWSYTMYDPPDPPVTPPTNDAFANAVQLTGSASSAAIQGTSVDATRQTGEPVGEHTVWYRWTPSQTGDARLVINTDTHLIEVYSGTQLDALTLLASTDVANSLQVGVTQGVSIFVRIRPDSTTGLFGWSFSTDVEPVPPDPPPDPAELLITSGPLPDGQVGSVYSSTLLTGTGGTEPYTWTATDIPPGLTLSTGGLLSGTPTASSTFAVFLTLTDAQPEVVTAVRTITITQEVPPSETLTPPITYLPNPNASGVRNMTTRGPYVRWFGVLHATSYQVFHGTSPSPPLIANFPWTQNQADYPQRSYLQQVSRTPKSTYYWKVCAVNADGQACTVVLRYSTK